MPHRNQLTWGELPRPWNLCHGWADAAHRRNFLRNQASARGRQNIASLHFLPEVSGITNTRIARAALTVLTSATWIAL